MNETDLRTRFARLRRELTTRTPPFGMLLEREPARAPAPRAWTPGLAVVSLCLLALGLLWLGGRPSRTSEWGKAVESVAETFATWGTPTDVLLRSPGPDLISTLPAFDLPSQPPGRPASTQPSSRIHARRYA